MRIKAQGDLAESSEYDQAAVLAGQNEAYTEQSTRVQDLQQQRQATDQRCKFHRTMPRYKLRN